MTVHRFALIFSIGFFGSTMALDAGASDDDHGNTRSSATRVALPSTTAGTIDPGNDTDYFRFEVASGGAVVLESAGDLDTIGTLFDASGGRIAQNDDGAGYPNFRIERTLAAGTYYVRVHSYGTATGAYTLYLRGDGGSGGSDRHGNTRSSATRVGLPSTTAGAIDPGNDTDYFRFEVASGGAVVLESAGGLDTVGTLFDASGRRIEQNDDGAGYPNFRIERTLAAGTYYVRVHSYGTATGAYTLHLRGGGSGDDSDRHGNTRSSATRVALPSTTTGRIDPGNDTDYFRFELSARASVVLETAGGLDTIGTLFNARGSRLEQDNDGAGRPNFRIERTLGAGTYYVRVHSRGTATGAYTLHLRGDGGSGGSDRHGNTRASATRVVLPSTTTGRIDPGNDTDYFRFEVSARASVVLETAGGLDTIGTLFNARGSRIAQNNDGAGRPNFRIERTLGAGTYYVRVHSRGTATGAYTLHLRTGGGSGGRLAISTAADSAVQPFEIFPLRVENGTAGADYDILIDLSGTGNFLDRNTIEVAPVTSADGDLMMAAPLPEALAEGNTARRFALLVRERGEGTLSNTLTFTLGRTDVPAALAGHPTVILDVVLKAVYEGLDDPLLAVEAGAIEPGRSVRVARALGLDTAYSDAQAEALLRSLFGVELVAPAGLGALSGRSQAASWQPSARVRCQFWAPNALCNAMEQLTDCVGDAMNGRLSGSPFRHCARLVREELAGGWTDYGEKINSFGNTLRGVAPRVARILGLGRRPAQAVYDINAAVRQGIGMNKTLRTITERAEALHQSFESLRDGTRTLTEGLPDLVAQVEQQAGADGVEGDEREATFALVEEADHHVSDAAAFEDEDMEAVYTGEADVVETLGTASEGGPATCAEGYEEFPVNDSTSTCVRSSLVEPNCYAGSREVSHPDLGGARACLYYSLDYLQPDGSCRENYAKVTFNGRETCRWAELETDRSAWYTLGTEHGVESPQHRVQAEDQYPSSCDDLAQRRFGRSFREAAQRWADSPVSPHPLCCRVCGDYTDIDGYSASCEDSDRCRAYSSSAFRLVETTPTNSRR